MGRYNFTGEQRKLLEGLSQPLAIYQFIDKRVVTLVLSNGFCKLFGYTDRVQAYYDMDRALWYTDGTNIRTYERTYSLLDEYLPTVDAAFGYVEPSLN